MRTLILGLGNPILSDDGVGWVVAQAVYSRVKPDLDHGLHQVDLIEGAVAGLTVVNLLAGYDRVIVVDAIRTQKQSPGTLYQMGLEDLNPTPRLASPHDVHLAQAIEVGRALGHPMPREVVIYAVEVEDPYTFSENLTPAVADAVPRIVDHIVSAEFGVGSDSESSV